MNEMIIKLSIFNQIATAKNSEKNKKISEKIIFSHTVPD